MMITIDGATGEGGGQILRTTISLAMCLQKAVRIENIRAGRKRPGLLRQHLAAVRCAAEICNAQLDGAQIGSGCLEFRPRAIAAGHYRVAIGSAGSTTLVLQTVLPALLMARGESTVALEGGTHNGMAPSFDFLDQAFAPLLLLMGAQVSLELERYGFYPNGGGRFVARVAPCAGLRSLTLLDEPQRRSTRASITIANIPGHVAERERAYIARKCQWDADAISIRQVESPGPGNIVSLCVDSEKVRELFEAVGSRGITAERVAGKAVKALRDYVAAKVPVGEYLCDQLLLPMVLGQGGRFMTQAPSLHTRTNIDVIEWITGATIDVTEVSSQQHVVSVPGLGVL